MALASDAVLKIASAARQCGSRKAADVQHQLHDDVPVVELTSQMAKYKCVTGALDGTGGTLVSLEAPSHAKRGGGQCNAVIRASLAKQSTIVRKPEQYNGMVMFKAIMGVITVACPCLRVQSIL